jgi:hypothetical protein
MADRAKHPSSRPIHRENKRGRGYWNAPTDGPVTPRLRLPATKDAIGFHRVASPDWYDEVYGTPDGRVK